MVWIIIKYFLVVINNRCSMVDIEMNLEDKFIVVYICFFVVIFIFVRLYDMIIGIVIVLVSMFVNVK